jgi:predicted RND superfamily exporter protein
MIVVSFFNKISKFPKTIIFITIVITFLSLYTAKLNLLDENGELTFTTTLEPLISRDSDAFPFFKRVQEIFGSEDMLIFLKNILKLELKFKKRYPGLKEF